MKFLPVAVLLVTCPPTSAAELTHEQALTALRRATGFFQDQLAAGNGAYLWQYAADLQEREGEEKATATQGWTQPPGTPTVGTGFLEAYLMTGQSFLLDAARHSGYALAATQLESGGWDYRIEFSPQARSGWRFRNRTGADAPVSSRAKNVTTLDDNTTQSALRFLMKLDTVLQQRDGRIHSTAVSALESLLKAQYPNGAWPQRYSAFPNPDDFPVLRASYPETWPREYPRIDYRSYYTFNDNTLADMIDVMLLAGELYSEPRYTAAARKAGRFILLAQMPEPQPIWAQQYNADMHPAWARRFEPAAVTGGESQGVIRSLLHLYRRTGDPQYLTPIPRALDFLAEHELPGEPGQVARFYELRTSRPLYFTRDTYILTHDDSSLPTHYGFKIRSDVKKLRQSYEAARKSGRETTPLWSIQRRRPGLSSGLARDAAQIAAALDSRGAWVEHGSLRARGNDPKPQNVITTRTFVRNLARLSAYVAATQTD
ncbi:MAG: pectate lyase [Planctomycetaceae bacterium]|jgi:hypothetical protein